MVLASLPARLRSERERLGLTLDAVAGLTGLSKAHLSRIESGERQPTIASLLTLAEALDVKVGALFGEDSGDDPSIMIYEADSEGETVNDLTIAPASGFRGSRDFSALRIAVHGDRREAPFARHHGEEWLHIETGTLHFDYDGVTHLLTAGQSVHFDAGRPHRLRAPDGDCELLLVATSTNDRLGSSHP
jgi:transcriptional regulator with XRE-family HTH domain